MSPVLPDYFALLPLFVKISARKLEKNPGFRFLRALVSLQRGFIAAKWFMMYEPLCQNVSSAILSYVNSNCFRISGKL